MNPTKEMNRRSFWDEPRESKGLFKREKVGSVEDAAAIGYKVVGQVDGSEDVFKEWEPVYAVIQALDAKVIIFKKKKRKNYRRTNGHRQELTRLRIIDIEGIDKPEVNSASEEPIAVEC